MLFGASGDLARKMLLPALYRLEERGALTRPVIGVAMTDWSSAEFRDHTATSIADAIPETLDTGLRLVGSVLDEMDRKAK